MAQDPPATGTWLVGAAPVFVIVLMAAHVFALVYWLYRLAAQKPGQRRKTH